MLQKLCLTCENSNNSQNKEVQFESIKGTNEKIEGTCSAQNVEKIQTDISSSKSSPNDHSAEKKPQVELEAAIVKPILKPLKNGADSPSEQIKNIRSNLMKSAFNK